MNQDFGGPASRSAVSAAVRAAKVSVKGVWGVQSATIVATFWAKANKGVQWAVLGNGIYDLEEFAGATASAGYKRMIREAQGKTDIDDFNEARSISWDTTGLPKKIQLYHGKANTVVPMGQGASFRDTLAAEGFKVSLEEVPKSGHEFNPGRHRLVLEALLKRINAAPKS